MIGRETKLRLAAKARLRFDARSGKQMLLYPERGLELSDTAAQVVALCRDDVTVAAIVDAMATTVPDAPRERIETDVLALLRALDARGLLVTTDAESA